MIVLENLSIRHGKTLIVDGINLTVPKGQIMVLYGPSGSGKTTIIRAIAGLTRPRAGRIIIDKQIVFDATIDVAPYQRSIGLVFQDLALWPHIKAKDNIKFALHSLRLSDAEQQQRVEELLEAVNLDPGERYPHQLSGGEQQRLAIARALAPWPRFLLLDEPLANLDHLLVKTIASLVRSLTTAYELSVLYVTHHLSEVETLADQVAVLYEGRIEQIGTLQELRANPATEFVAHYLNG